MSCSFQLILADRRQGFADVTSVLMSKVVKEIYDSVTSRVQALDTNYGAI
jgi:hypothetical protein